MNQHLQLLLLMIAILDVVIVLKVKYLNTENNGQESR